MAIAAQILRDATFERLLASSLAEGVERHSLIRIRQLCVLFAPI